MKPTQEDVVQPGEVVGGYRIEKKLGAGGYGKVYLAWRDGSPCALKFIHLESVGEWGWRELYIMLRHEFPHVVKLLSHFKWPEDKPEYLVLVMEYVPGVTLYQWARDNNPCARELVEMLLPLAHALKVGEVLREARLKAELTQADVAERVGLATEVYGRMERGNLTPSVPILRKLCLALRVDANAALLLEVGKAVAWL